MRLRGLSAVLLLPGNVLLVIPALLLWATAGGGHGWRLAVPSEAAFWAALACFAAGLLLMARSIAHFARKGRGTLAPWDPPETLVVEGIYRRVRNPMISGVVLNLLGEALLFHSAPLFAWAGLFLLGNALYIPLVEEPGLERRFGESYRRYRRAVPRWIPRLRPWQG